MLNSGVLLRVRREWTFNVSAANLHSQAYQVKGKKPTPLAFLLRPDQPELQTQLCRKAFSGYAENARVPTRLSLRGLIQSKGRG